jgi:hypothetical protein
VWGSLWPLAHIPNIHRLADNYLRNFWNFPHCRRSVFHRIEFPRSKPTLHFHQRSFFPNGAKNRESYPKISNEARNVRVSNVEPSDPKDKGKRPFLVKSRLPSIVISVPKWAPIVLM